MGEEKTLIGSIKMNMSYMIRRKTTVLTFFVLMIYVLMNFFNNMKTNVEIEYVSQMYDIVKVSGLSGWLDKTNFFMEYFPLLLMIPTAYCYIIDKNTNIKVYIESRVGKRNYLYGKMIAVFLTTFLVFTLPFFIEIFMSCICFDVSSLGDPSNFGFEQTVVYDGTIFMSDLFFYSRILYGVVWIAIFGAIAGALAVFNFAVCTLDIFKYKVLTFFPVYGLVFLITFIDKIFKPSFTLHYPFILEMFEFSPKNYAVYGGFMIVIAVVSVVLVEVRIKRKELR